MLTLACQYLMSHIMRTIKKWSLVPSRHQISTNHKWHNQMFFGSGMEGRGGEGGSTFHSFALNVNNHTHMIISANFKQGVVRLWRACTCTRA